MYIRTLSIWLIRILPFTLTGIVACSSQAPISQKISSEHTITPESLVTPISPTGESPGWDNMRIFVWSEVGGATEYSIQMLKPEILSCTLPDGRHTATRAGATRQTNIQANICSNGKCQFEGKDTLGGFTARKPGGNVKLGPCHQGDLYTYTWAVRAIGPNLQDSYSPYLSFTLP